MSIDEIYLKMVHSISEAIKTQWCVAKVNFECEEGAGEFECTYIDVLEPGIDHDFDVTYETYKAFNDLHEITAEGGEYTWNKAKLTLYPTGVFSIDFE